MVRLPQIRKPNADEKTTIAVTSPTNGVFDQSSCSLWRQMRHCLVDHCPIGSHQLLLVCGLWSTRDCGKL